MKNKALVVKTEKDMAEVLVYRAEACGSCDSCSACDQKPQTQWVQNILHAKAGDSVYVEMKTEQFLGGLLKLYGLPLVLFFAGIAAAMIISAQFGKQNELIGLLGGFAGLGIYVVIARVMDRKIDPKTMIRMISFAQASNAQGSQITDSCCSTH